MYASESAINLRNQGVAHLLQSYGRLYADPDETTDLYTRQCSLLVTAFDLAAMGATLANGGGHPLTGRRVVESFHCKHVLAALASAACTSVRVTGSTKSASSCRSRLPVRLRSARWRGPDREVDRLVGPGDLLDLVQGAQHLALPGLPQLCEER